MFSEIVKRLNFCIEVEGNTFEQYLWTFSLWIKTYYSPLSNKKKIFDKDCLIGELYAFIKWYGFLGHPVHTKIQNDIKAIGFRYKILSCFDK